MEPQCQDFSRSELLEMAKFVDLRPEQLEEELAAGVLSKFHVVKDGDARYAVVAAGSAVADEAPTILAIPGGPQTKVAKSFLRCRADARDWQVVVPLNQLGKLNFAEDADRNKRDGAYCVERLAEALIDGTLTSARRVEGRLHLFGDGNGSMAVLKLACLLHSRRPGRVASVTVMAGICHTVDEDLEPLRGVSVIRLIAGEHGKAMHEFKQRLDTANIHAEFVEMKGVDRESIGEHVDMDQFWQSLLAAHSGQAPAPCSGRPSPGPTPTPAAVDLDPAAAPMPVPAAVPELAGQGEDDEPIVHDLADLVSGTPANVNAAHKERYLSQLQFQEAFGMTIEEFEKLPGWKKSQAKKKIGLF